MRRHPDLLAVSAFAVVAAAVVLAVPVTAVRVAFALPLCLVAPGYAVTEAAFARHTLTGALRVLLTAALSLCVLILGALVLNELREGIRDVTWAVGLAAVVVACCAVAGARRVRPPAPLRLPAASTPRLADALLVLVAIAVVTTAALVSRTTTEAKVVGYTQMWLLPTGDPVARQVVVGVRSGELEDRAFRLELQVGREDQRVIAQRIELSPGEAHEQVITLPPARPGRDPAIAAVLFRTDDPARPYRKVDTGALRQRPAR